MCLVGGSGLSVGDTVTVLDGREWELSILQLLVCWPSVTECESKVLAVVSKVDSTNFDITSDCDKGSVATRIGLVGGSGQSGGGTITVLDGREWELSIL